MIVGMPSFADLPAAELASLATYLRRINADTILVPLTAKEPVRKITWDAVRERVVDDPEAKAMLARPQRREYPFPTLA